ncbi:MAG: hypothetical protein AB7U95_31300 [Reyranella sp.]
MPLYGHRLFGSEFNACCTDAEWRAGITLWWAAWNQVPAASLPDDDVALARLADLGRDVRGWRKLRVNALHGFVKCSDGRLYHKALAPIALEAWDRRVKERERKARYRAARERAETQSRDVPETGTETGTMGGTGTSCPTREREAKRSEAKKELRAAAAQGNGLVAEDGPPTPDPSPPAEPIERDETIPPTLDRRPNAGKIHELGAAVLAALGVADDPRWLGNYGRVESWLAQGADPELDILPTIRRLMARRPNDPPRSLRYFDQAISDAVEARRQGLPPPQAGPGSASAAAREPWSDEERERLRLMVEAEEAERTRAAGAGS